MNISRRTFITNIAIAGVSLALPPIVYGATPKPKLTVGFLQGANSVAITLLGRFMPNYQVSYRSFSDISTITAALTENDIQVAQNIYTAFLGMVSKGLPVSAVSGQCNGGSDLVVRKDLLIPPGSWQDLKKVITEYKAKGKHFRIASFFGSVQDIELRLLLEKMGITVNADVHLINVPYPGMSQAMASGAAEAAAPVQPFGVEMELSGLASHFVYPYDQPAGDLTNLVLMADPYISSSPAVFKDVGTGMIALTEYLKTTEGQHLWGQVVAKYSNVSSKAIDLTLEQLTPSYTLPIQKMLSMGDAMAKYGFLDKPISKEQLLQHIHYAPA
ncbi:ABC transporter substrate-binding protein [Acidithiobacillus sp. IBUN Pt1247-S3]|uniref:ABC transporter substrate-binding protein n=1 Tax=Acidithiobacillus sp. IBUN Pt1247-S3 TaxID=3166642 RepID=UPI0034E4FC41